MRILNALHHPTGYPRQFNLVGRILCHEGRADIAVDSEAPRVPDNMLSNLRHLVAMSLPRPFENLLSLENNFWSFVEVEA